LVAVRGKNSAVTKVVKLVEMMVSDSAVEMDEEMDEELVDWKVDNLAN
jgi:hypothetical protein